MSMLLTLLLAGQTMVGANKQDYRFSVAKSRSVMTEFGRCIAKRKPALARAYIEDESQLTNKAIFDSPLASYCMQEGASMRFQPSTARGAMAEYLVGQDMPSIPELKLDGVRVAYAPAIVSLTDDKGNPMPLGSLSASNQTLLRDAATDPVLRIGDCLVRNDHVNARTLLRTKINGADENAAVKALVSALQGCVPKGRTLQIDKTGIRTGVAIAYYRLARAPGGGPK